MFIILLSELLAVISVVFFDPISKGYITLVPCSWSLPNCKDAMLMHHDIAVLEQVSLHKLQTTNHFVFVFIFGTCSLSKAFCKHPLESDTCEWDTHLRKEGDKAGIVHWPSHPLHIWWLFSAYY